MKSPPYGDPLPVLTAGDRDSYNAWRKNYPDIALNYSGENLESANLSDFNLSDVEFIASMLDTSVLMGADLSKAQLQRASMAFCSMTGANLTGAFLEGANLEWAAIDSANLMNAKLNNANLYYADLSGTDLRSACLAGANICGISFKGCLIDYQTDFSGVTIDYKTLNGPDMPEDVRRRIMGASPVIIHHDPAKKEIIEIMAKGAEVFNKWRKEKRLPPDISGMSLADINLDGMNLSGMRMIGCTFPHSRKICADFSGAILARCAFEYLDLSGSCFDDADMEGTKFVGCKFNKKTSFKRVIIDAQTLMDENKIPSTIRTHIIRNGYTLKGASQYDPVPKQILTFQGVVAYNEWRAKNGQRGPYMNAITMPGANLAGVNLSAAHLQEENVEKRRKGEALAVSNLEGADLTGANLQEANLTGAKLRNVILTRTDMQGARLYGADLKGVVFDPDYPPNTVGVKIDGSTKLSYRLRHLIEKQNPPPPKERWL